MRNWRPPKTILLFQQESLAQFLDARLVSAVNEINKRADGHLLNRSVDDLTAEYMARVSVEPLHLRPDPVDGDVQEGVRPAQRDPWGDVRDVPVTVVSTEFEFEGTSELWNYRASSYTLTSPEAEIRTDTNRLVIHLEYSGTPDAETVQKDRSDLLSKIRRRIDQTNNDVATFLQNLDRSLRTVIEARREKVLAQRGLAAELGFPIERRADAPTPVPVNRRRISTPRGRSQASGREFVPEHEMAESDYEAVVEVITGTLTAMERTPSAASGKPEEELRDQILVQLNGTFRGAATGETFVKSGKTDILVTVEDRHVFVGECKWWRGPKSFWEAIDQLLGYLPWRNEKAALILFIDQRDASAVIEKADETIRKHPTWKRVGAASSDDAQRRNHILGHPDDLDREIRVAVLFAVLPAVDGEVA